MVRIKVINNGHSLPIPREVQQLRIGTTLGLKRQRAEVMLLGPGESWSQKGGLVRAVSHRGR